MQATETKKEYRTLSQLLDSNAGECMDTLARVAPAIERVATKSGLLELLVEKHGTAKDEDEAKEIVKNFISAFLVHGLGDCNGDILEIIAAINNMTAAEIREQCTGWEIVSMVKEIISDKDFFTSLQSFLQ